MGHAQNVTPNLGLQLPSHNAPNWDTALNANFNAIDAYLSAVTALPQLHVTNAVTAGSFVGPLFGNVIAAIVAASAQTQKNTNDYSCLCSMSSGTTCNCTINTTYNFPYCSATAQSNTVTTSAGCLISGSTANVKAAASNSAQWAVLVWGNPN